MTQKTSQQIIAEAQEVQKSNPPSSKAWKVAHLIIKQEVQKMQGVDIDGAASCKH